MGKARHRKGPILTGRALITLVTVVAAIAGLPFSPLVGTASAASGSSGSPVAPTVDFAYALTGDSLVRVTATVHGPAAGGFRLALPGSFQDLGVAPGSVRLSLDGGTGGEPATLSIELGAEKATVSAAVGVTWRAGGDWSWTSLSAVTPTPQGAFRLGGLTATGEPAAYVVGGLSPGQGLLIRGPGAPLTRWRLTVADGRLEVYLAGPTPPEGLVEVAALAREYGLFGRERLVLLATGPAAADLAVSDLAADDPSADSASAIDLATQYWEAALDWDLGDDQQSWLRGVALLSLAATSAEPRVYLEALVTDLTIAATAPSSTADVEPAVARARGEALVLAVNEAIRERTDGRVGFDEVLRYLSAYGNGVRLDPFWLRQTSIAAVARDVSDVFDRFYPPATKAGPAVPPAPAPAPWTAVLPALVADDDQDGRPDFIDREAGALLSEAAVRAETSPIDAVAAVGPAFVAAGEVRPGAAAESAATEGTGAAVGGAAANGAGANGGPATLPPTTEGRWVAYLTFDDGPSAVTRQVLKILRDEGVPATFFVIANRVRAYADTLRLTVQDGHVIGNHTYDHDNANVYQSPEAFLASLERAGQVIFDVAGVRPTVARAPGGSKAHFTREYYSLLAENGYTIYDWDVSAADTDPSHPSAEIIADNVLAGARGRRAPVILMHDGPGHEPTAEALPAIIRGLREEGFEFGTLQPR